MKMFDYLREMFAINRVLKLRWRHVKRSIISVRLLGYGIRTLHYVKGSMSRERQMSWMRQSNAEKKIVVTSTAGVLGPSDSIPIDEKCERTSKFFNSYELSKFEMEKKVLEYAAKGLLVVIVNPTRVFGPGILSEANSATKIINAYIHGKWHFIPGKGNSIGNYVFIDDVVKGHILAMEKGLPGERYILGGTNLNFLDFFSAIAAVSGKRYWMIRLPAQMLIFISSLVFFISRLFGKPPRLAPSWIKRYLLDWAVSSKKAEHNLGYRITPIEEGLEKTVQWLRKDKIIDIE